MGLKLRQRIIKGGNTSSLDIEPNDNDDDASTNGQEKKSSGDLGLVMFLMCGLISLVFAITQDLKAAGGLSFTTEGVRLSIGEDVAITLDMKRLNDNEVSLGPHEANVVISKSPCATPRIWMRLKGDALVLITLHAADGDTTRFTSTFSMPVEGKYELETRWYGCGNEATFKSPEEQVSFKAGNGGTSSVIASQSSDASLFPPGLWLHKDRFKEANSNNIKGDYVWFPHEKVNTAETIGKFYNAKSAHGESTVAIEGNPVSEHFGSLSNYELVCWVGGEGSAASREAFLSMRGEINSGQRPFKFHYYPMTDFTKPDKDWDDTKKGGFRKCKNVLVSLDGEELQSAEISQAEYTKQVLGFLGHLVKCLHDDTFPIWMFTLNTPAMKPSKLCHSRSRLTHHHPCNDALFTIFEKKYLPSRVKLLDNTDLVGPQFDDTNIQKDVTAVIAMRIFALVGAQVQIWRAANQMGKKEGLMRNGTLEVNEAHSPYQFN